MTLGGYKFSGRFCQRGSLTDTEWVLLMHKTRVKAFIESSIAANAGWSFDQTGGTVAFETYGNVIYKLDDLGYNYVSFMKQGTDNPTYIAILTACYWSSTADLANGIIDGPWQLRFTVDSGRGLACNNSMYHRMSQSQLTTSNLFSSIANASSLIPCGQCIATASNAGMNVSKNLSFPSQSSFYAGYAIKNETVLTFTGSSISTSYLHVSVLANYGFKTLKINNDTNNWFAINPFGESSNNTNYGEAASRYSLTYGNGYAPNENGEVNMVTVCFNPDAAFENVIAPEAIPYSNVSVFGTQSEYANTFIKGCLKTEIISTNLCKTAIDSSEIYKAVANGNLLFVFSLSVTIPILGFTYDSPSSFSSASYYCMVYVGWDPSNPDITQASSWTEYTLS